MSPSIAPAVAVWDRLRVAVPQQPFIEQHIGDRFPSGEHAVCVDGENAEALLFRGRGPVQQLIPVQCVTAVTRPEVEIELPEHAPRIEIGQRYVPLGTSQLAHPSLG